MGGVAASHGLDSEPHFWSDAQLHAQSVSRRLNCLDKSFLPRRGKHTSFKLLVYGLYIEGDGLFRALVRRYAVFKAEKNVKGIEV
jgi:hypothetical protein